MVNPQTHQIGKIARTDVGPSRRLPGHGQRMESVLQAGHQLPGAVLAPADRQDAVISMAATFGVSDHLSEGSFPLAPINVRLLCMRSAGIAHALPIKLNVGPRSRRDTVPAVLHTYAAHSSRNILLLRK